SNRWVFGSSFVNVLGGPVTLGWHLVTLVQDAAAGARRIYVDGSLTGSATGTYAADGPGDLWLGGSKGFEQDFDGAVDDLRIYNRALADTEIQQLLAPSLVGQWKLDEGAGTAAGDASGNGLKGVISGAVTWVSGKVGSGALSFQGTGGHVEV